VRKEKYDNINLLKFIATICVILIHVVSGDLYKYGTISNSDWNIANAINSISRICVPVFLMVSGALLLSKDESIEDFFKKRFLRIIPKFLLFSIFYYLIDVYYLHHQVHNFIVSLLQGEVFYHLWYVYMILGIYLLAPFLRKIIHNIEDKYVWYFLIVWFFFMSLIPFIEFVTKLNLKIYNPLGQYIGYFILGYYLLNTRKIKQIPLIVFNLIFALLTVVLSYYYTKKSGKLVDYFYNYHSITVFFQSITIYLIVIGTNLTNILEKATKLDKIIKEGSRLSFDIYLIHPIILLLLEQNIKLRMNYSFYIIISFTITVITSYIIAKSIEFLLNKRRKKLWL
jgi:surface polysaccharide O-acyltransferase-like enzyme